MTSAGRRDSLITLQRFTATQDEYGEEIQTWADRGKEWAAVYLGRGDERRQAAQEQAVQAATFNMLSNGLTRGAKVEDRIVWDGSNWDVVSIAPDAPKRGEIEMTAKRVQ